MEPSHDSHSLKETSHFSPKESCMNRYKPIWRILLISNLALGAYIFVHAARKKSSSIANKKPAKTEEEFRKNEPEQDVPSDPMTDVLVHEEPPILSFVAKPPKVLDPIPEDQQGELFKLKLEDKRKVQPNDPEEKKRIDKEKSFLKQFIRAESFPRI